MSVIERWWRIDFHDHSEWTSNEENARDASEHYDYPVAGPFVLEAQQPQGAVDALRDVRSLAANQHIGGTAACRRIIAAVDEALGDQPVGGQ